MIQRDAMDEVRNDLFQVVDHYEENPEIFKSRDQIECVRDHFTIKTIFLGHFNSGKSSLVNALIERNNFLEEAQVPQTSICAELKYGQEEMIRACLIDGTEEAYVQNKEYTPDAYQGIYYTMDVPALAALDGYTVVDTPGFDSYIDSHEQALAHYMMQGSIYLFVIDVEKGCIDYTTMTKIKAVYRRCPRIAILFNKCDKISNENRAQIVEHSKVVLSGFGIVCPVLAVSKYDTDISQKLVALIQSFSAQEIFEQQMKEIIAGEAKRILMILTTTRDRVFLDTFDYNLDIKMLQRKKDSLMETLESKRKALKRKNPEKTKEILEKVRVAMEDISNQVANVILMGNHQGVQSIISEAIRGTLSTAMVDLVDRFYVDVTGSLDFTGIDSGCNNDVNWMDTLESTGEKIKDLYEMGSFVSPVKELDPLKRGAYKAITGISAIFTSFNPLLEIAVIFLPEILQLIRGIFGESDVTRARNRYEKAIIPQVISSISKPVEDAVYSATDAVLDQVETWVGENLDALDKAITTAMSKKETSETEFRAYVNMLEKDIATLQNLMVN